MTFHVYETQILLILLLLFFFLSSSSVAAQSKDNKSTPTFSLPFISILSPVNKFHLSYVFSTSSIKILNNKLPQLPVLRCFYNCVWRMYTNISLDSI